MDRIAAVYYRRNTAGVCRSI